MPAKSKIILGIIFRLIALIASTWFLIVAIKTGAKLPGPSWIMITTLVLGYLTFFAYLTTFWLEYILDRRKRTA